MSEATRAGDGFSEGLVITAAADDPAAMFLTRQTQVGSLVALTVLLLHGCAADDDPEVDGAAVDGAAEVGPFGARLDGQVDQAGELGSGGNADADVDADEAGRDDAGGIDASAPDVASPDAPGSEAAPGEVAPPPVDAPDSRPDLPVDALGPDGCALDEFRAEQRCVSDVVQVAAYRQRTCSVHRDGSVWCWGGTPFLSRPQRVPGLNDARAVAIGGHPFTGDTGLACAITRNNGVVCWGSPYVGKLGNGNPDPYAPTPAAPTPVVVAGGAALQGVRELSLGIDFGCATTATEVYCWGSNAYQQLAVAPGPTAGQVRYPSGTPADLYFRPFAAPAPAAPGPLLTLAGEAAMSSDGARVCAWGDNSEIPQYFGTLGYGSTGSPICRPQSDIVQLVGGYGGCVRLRNGDVSCWGYYLGTSQFPGARAALGPSAQIASGGLHVCSLGIDGRVFCWGVGADGQLANGKGTPGSTQVSAPVEITGFGGQVVALGSGPTALHTCAILADGSLRCWGNNEYAQLANAEAGTHPQAPVPVKWF